MSAVPSPLPSRPSPPARGTAAPDAVAIDFGQAGVVLRTVLFVHGVVALGRLFGADSLAGWLVELSATVAAVLPATLLWLLAGRALQGRLVRWPAAGQWGAVLAGGALAGGFAGVELRWLGQVGGPGGVPGALAAVLAGAALAAAVFEWLCQRARLTLPAATQARLAELQSRIRPHFLFNALNSAITLVQIDPARAEDVLEDLAELFRAALVGSDAPVTLADEIALARRYLAIEQVRFGERLRVHWQIEPATGAAQVPALLLQPLVENAVKHGVEPSPDGGEVHVRTEVRRGLVLLTVTNSVTAAAPARPGHGIALRNVRERLLLLHDLTARFEAGPIEGGRFRVRMAFPLGAAPRPPAPDQGRRQRPTSGGRPSHEHAAGAARR